MQQAASVPTGEYDLILDPSYFSRVLLETLLPQLDPMTVHGLSGDVPAAPLFGAADIGSAQVASELLNLRYDNTLAQGLATFGWDDAGRPAGSGDFVRNGVLAGLPWCEEIPAAGNPAHGSSRAGVWSAAPRFSMPNIVVAPAANGRSLDDMIANTERGILLSGKGTTERSVNRRWFRGDAQAAWLIEKGKKTRAVRDYAVDAALHYFWSKLSEIGGTKDARLCGDLFPQNAHANWELPFSLSMPPARFTRISVLNRQEEAR
jgi:predicted Zn-dependent protease